MVSTGSVSVELLWEETPEHGGRDRRSAQTLPGQLAFQFSMGGEKVELNLKRNPDLNTHTPEFVVRGGQVVTGSQYGETDAVSVLLVQYANVPMKPQSIYSYHIAYSVHSDKDRLSAV